MTIYVERTARKRHDCAWDCGSPIERGTRYVRAATPPWSEPNESDHWWYAALHGRYLDSCPTYNPGMPSDPVAAEMVWQA